MEEAVRLRAIVAACETVLERLAGESEPSPAGFIEDVKRLRDQTRAKRHAWCRQKRRQAMTE